MSSEDWWAEPDKPSELVLEDDDNWTWPRRRGVMPFLRGVHRLEYDNFIGHVNYRVFPSITNDDTLFIEGQASTFAQNEWNWPERVMRVELQFTSPTVAVSKRLFVAEEVRGKGYSKTFFGFYSGVARQLGVTTLLAFVKATNEVQINRLRALGWADLGEYGVERVEEGECVRPHILKKELVEE